MLNGLKSDEVCFIFCSKVWDKPKNLFNQGCKALDDSEYPKNVSNDVCEPFDEINKVRLWSYVHRKNPMSVLPRICQRLFSG